MKTTGHRSNMLFFIAFVIMTMPALFSEAFLIPRPSTSVFRGGGGGGGDVRTAVVGEEEARHQQEQGGGSTGGGGGGGLLRCRWRAVGRRRGSSVAPPLAAPASLEYLSTGGMGPSSLSSHEGEEEVVVSSSLVSRPVTAGGGAGRRRSRRGRRRSYEMKPLSALKVGSATSSSTSIKNKRPGVRSLQVITDVDDTIKSSGGVRLLGIALGGIDVQYPRGQFYPGGSQFALELARYGAAKGRQPNRIAVLTARAREFKFALELKPSHPICVKYAATGIDSGVQDWGVGTVLYGSVKEWICQSRKGLRKFRNFEALKAMDTGNLTDYVFIGDTGEGDLQAGESMVRKYPNEIKALFMHYVSDVKPLPLRPLDRTLLGVPIIYFRTYVGAASRALELGLLDAKGVQAVMDKAGSELEARGQKSTEDQWDDLLSDMEEARRTVVATEEQSRKKGGGVGVGGIEGLPQQLDELKALWTKLFPPPPPRQSKARQEEEGGKKENIRVRK